MRVAPALVLLALVLTSCSSEPARRSISEPSATSSPSAAAVLKNAATDGAVIVAVTDEQGVALARIGADRVAHRFALLLPPSTGAMLEEHEVTLSAGVTPDVCVLWSAQHVRYLHCYPFGSDRGVPVASADTSRNDIRGISLSPDGSRIAWVERPNLSASDDAVNDHALVTAHYARGVLTDRHEDVVDGPGSRSQGDECRYPYRTSWLGDDRVLMSCSGDNDANGGYVVQALPFGSGAGSLSESHAGRFNQYPELVAYSATEALGYENQYCDITCDDGKPREQGRAVRVDLRTGTVKEVLAFAAAGRFVGTVSGGAHGIVYTTSAQNASTEQERVYLALPGEKHGTLVRGLTGPVLAAQP